MDGVSFTFLYSDVGPTFYGRLGWVPRHSDQMVIPTSHSIGDQRHQETVILEDVTDHNLRDVVARDALLLRKTLTAQLEKSTDGKMVLVAVTPEINCIQWLGARSKFLAQHALQLEQQIRVWGVKDTRSDSFALWYHDLLHDELYIIRLRLDPSAAREHVARALIQAAQNEAKRWNVSKIVIWNPDPVLVDLTRLEVKQRDSSISSIGFVSDPSLNTKDVEWVLNEKYGW